ncbi:MAG: hypothetical protein HYX56_00790 [Chloroflexi bacterium]|nr:hypothetical protein [Chloroflexota bacterium]
MEPLIAAVVVASTVAAALWLRAPVVERRSPEAQAALERAVAAVDRELAADLELTTMFDQTKQAFVMELGQFEAWREVLAREAPAAFPFLADLYGRIPAMESAMERRGPAGSISDADRALVNEWEGDAREAQRSLRASTVPRRATRWRWLRERLAVRRSAT